MAKNTTLGLEDGPFVGISVLIFGDCDANDRRELYQDQLGDALRKGGVGRIIGAGCYFEEPEAEERAAAGDEALEPIAAVNFIDLDAPDPIAALPTVLACIRKAQKARGWAERVELEFTSPTGQVLRAPVTPPH